MDHSSQRVFVVYNPKAGNADQSDNIRLALADHFAQPQWTLEIYEITGKEDVSAICHAACERGASLVIAAGGDGTVVGVANGLVHSRVPLGILPLGTGNDLARVLGIPLKLDKALALLVDDHAVIEVDALKVGDCYFFSNVSVGISPHMVDNTNSAQKKRFGRLAYLWTILKRLGSFRLEHYTLTIDGQSQQSRASEVLISNTTLLESLPHLFGPSETLNDGQLEVYLVMAHTVGGYLQLAWDLLRQPGQSAANLHHWTARHSIRIDADRHSRLVQADGEVIGHTPVEIQLVPKALHVIMPKTTVNETVLESSL
ncbi:MAG: diacylglycerol kinase family lipid kinase [Chloroflexi bacterium]|nr:diacylglycerol kinase family lipid kinase [Chloroflexota bacterium]